MTLVSGVCSQHSGVVALIVHEPQDTSSYRSGWQAINLERFIGRFGPGYAMIMHTLVL